MKVLYKNGIQRDGIMEEKQKPTPTYFKPTSTYPYLLQPYQCDSSSNARQYIFTHITLIIFLYRGEFTSGALG